MCGWLVNTEQNFTISPRFIFSLLILVAVVWLAVRLTDVLILLSLAVLVAAVMQPPVAWLVRWGVPRSAAVTLLYLVLLVMLALLGYFLAPVFTAQISRLADGEWYTQFQQLSEQWPAQFRPLSGSALLTEFATQWDFWVQSWIAALGRWAISLGNLLFNGVLALALAYFLAIDPNSPRRLLFDLLPEPYHHRMYHWSGLMGEQVVRWAWSQGLLSLYIAVVYGVGLYILGVPNALLLAVIGGMLEVIPYLGGVITALAAVLLTLPYSATTALAAVIWYMLVNQVENYILIPRLYRRTMQLHPLLVLIAFMVGGQVLGVIGMVLAIPLAAAVQAAWEHRDRFNIPGAAGENVHHDPVCSMQLTPEVAHSSFIYRGQPYYFCSERCYKIFLTWPVDPVCQQKVMPAIAEQVTYQGKTYYFSDPDCARKFVDAPASWLSVETPSTFA